MVEKIVNPELSFVTFMAVPLTIWNQANGWAGMNPTPFCEDLLCAWRLIPRLETNERECWKFLETGGWTQIMIREYTVNLHSFPKCIWYDRQLPKTWPLHELIAFLLELWFSSGRHLAAIVNQIMKENSWSTSDLHSFRSARLLDYLKNNSWR